MGLEPATPQSQVKQSTNEPQHSSFWVLIEHMFKIVCSFFKNEPRHKITNNVVYATSKASDQPAHMRSLIRAFASHLNILWLLSYWPNSIWSF